MKRKLDEEKTEWVNELPGVLMGYRASVRTPTGQSLFALVYGAEAVLPIERIIPTSRTRNYDVSQNEDLLQAELDLLEEGRIEAAIWNEVYHRRMRHDYNKRVCQRDFKIGDMVLRKTILNTRNPTNGELGANWEGPYIISGLRKNGTYELVGYQGKKALECGKLEAILSLSNPICSVTFILCHYLLFNLGTTSAEYFNLINEKRNYERPP